MAQQDTAETSPKKGTRKKSPAGVLPAGEVADLLTRKTATISMFGRMIAELQGGEVSGAIQAAPAFTTHTSDPQPDFFTAVEDWPPVGDKGSAHLDTAFLTTGVFYRFATVNLTDLTRNLQGDHEQAHRLLALFIEAFILTLPQAKKNSTAPHTIPDLVHYVVRDRRPVTYAGAFEQPIKAATGGGYLAQARHTLTEHALTLDRLIGTRRRIEEVSS